MSSVHPARSRRAPLLVAAVLLAACGAPTETAPLARFAVVQGTLSTAPGTSGSAWVFLYRHGEGPPGAPAVPAFVTAISRERFSSDPHFVFGRVDPNLLRLWAMVDTNGNFDPNVDVLAQPGAGDRVGDAVDVNVQPGVTQSFDFTAAKKVEREPPAFSVLNAPADVALQQRLDAQTAIPLVADALEGRLDAKKVGFDFHLVDANGDGVPDDLNGDGTPDLSLTFVLVWQPLPGQAQPGQTLIVPLLFNPTPVLRSLGTDLTASVVVPDLQLAVVPQAQWLHTDERGRRVVEPAGAPPAGEYHLTVLASDGRFWQVPNGLATGLPSQATRFHFDRAGP